LLTIGNIGILIVAIVALNFKNTDIHHDEDNVQTLQLRLSKVEHQLKENFTQRSISPQPPIEKNQQQSTNADFPKINDTAILKTEPINGVLK